MAFSLKRHGYRENKPDKPQGTSVYCGFTMIPILRKL